MGSIERSSAWAEKRGVVVGTLGFMQANSVSDRPSKGRTPFYTFGFPHAQTVKNITMGWHNRGVQTTDLCSFQRWLQSKQRIYQHCQPRLAVAGKILAPPIVMKSASGVVGVVGMYMMLIFVRPWTLHWVWNVSVSKVLPSNGKPKKVKALGW